MTVAQIVTTWTGGPSSPGMTVMCVDDSGTSNYEAAVAAVAAFWNAIDEVIPNEYSLQVSPLVEIFNEATGALSGEVQLNTASTPAPTIGLSAGAYMHGVGTRIDWRTSSIRNGRRVSGRTFIVPTHAPSFTDAGILAPISVSLLGNAAETLLDSLTTAQAPLVVWSRPSLKNPVGAIAPVLGATVPTKAAVLRGRRD